MDEAMSISELARVLVRDRRTISRALQTVPPDGHKAGAACWRLVTARAALSKHEERTSYYNHTRPRVDSSACMRHAEAIERALNTMQANFARLEAEPSIARRRELALHDGLAGAIGILDTALGNSIEETSGLLVGPLTVWRDTVLRETVGRLLVLLDWRIADMPSEAAAQGNGENGNAGPEL